MVYERVRLEAVKPIQLAREQLGKTLQRVQQLSAAEKIAQSISDALGVLFEAETADSAPDTLAEGAQAAMEHLQCAVDLLRAETIDPSAIDATLAIQKSVAKTLALLYPISKLAGGPSRIPDSPFKHLDDSPASERRTARRIAIEADIGFQSDTNFFMGFTEDISTGGLFISTYDVREIGAKILVNFTLPNGRLISVDGIVRWVRIYNETTPDTTPGMGIQFENLLTDDKAAIQAFTEQRAPIFYDA